MLSVTACNGSLTFSDIATGMFRVCRKRAKEKISDLKVQPAFKPEFKKWTSKPAIGPAQMNNLYSNI